MNGLPSGAVAAVHWLGLIVAIVIAATAGTASEFRPDQPALRPAQAGPDAGGRATAGNAPDLRGIGLTAAHKRIIYENVAGDRPQALFGDQRPAVGTIIPNSVMLNEMPIAVKDQVGLLQDFKFARLTGDHVLIVDPASRKIVDIITKEEGGGR